eukprot:SAG11_NODE_4654_length_1820_cov_0.908193_1_plen_27_part_10
MERSQSGMERSSNLDTYSKHIAGALVD